MKQTKIVCTIGPASESIKTLTAMVKAGMNVARLNFSHGTYENHAMLIKNIRNVASKLSLPVAIMQDLQGPKIRVAELPAPLAIKAGQQIIIGKDFPLDFDVAKYVKPQQRILIEDGTIELQVIKVEGKTIVCQAMTNGLIQSHKGINLPDTKVTFPILTDKDIRDLQFGLQQNVDFVAVSFVRSKKDIINIKSLIKKYNPKNFLPPQVVAKIERPEAVKLFDSILKEVDVIMVARGDLGVEIADSQVPIVQKDIIKKCIHAAKPVIVATQMLDSMIRNPRPTRAEVSDVANAVIDGTDAVMLSGESAFGKYPIEAVTEMARIVETTEGSAYNGPSCPYNGLSKKVKHDTASAICKEVLGHKVDAVVVYDDQGTHARFVAHARPHVPIFVITTQPKNAHQIYMLRSVMPVIVNAAIASIEDLKKHLPHLQKAKLLKKGQTVAVVNTFKGKSKLIELVKVK